MRRGDVLLGLRLGRVGRAGWRARPVIGCSVGFHDFGDYQGVGFQRPIALAGGSLVDSQPGRGHRRPHARRGRRRGHRGRPRHRAASLRPRAARAARRARPAPGRVRARPRASGRSTAACRCSGCAAGSRSSTSRSAGRSSRISRSIRAGRSTRPIEAGSAGRRSSGPPCWTSRTCPTIRATRWRSSRARGCTRRSGWT